MTGTGTQPAVDLLPGYYLDELGAWLTLPWPGDPALPFGHRDRLRLLPPSLGPEIIAWAEGNRGTPGLRDYLTGQPWTFTNAQRRFLYLWYAVREDGRWLYRSGVKRGAKGTGKDPLAAAVALIEARGPARLHDWDEKTNTPIGRRHGLALVQIAANSEAQAGDVLRVMNAMMSDDFRAEHLADPGVLRTQFWDGSRVELLTNSEASSEGDPATAILLNESHHMKPSNGGQKLAGVARRNVGKSPGGTARLLELTNAHMPGEHSVAEDSFDAWQDQVGGRTRRVDILYDSREAAPSLRLHVEHELELGIAQAYADSPWTDKERIRDEAQDPRVAPQDSVRYYFNSLPVNDTAWVDPRRWDAAHDGRTVDRGDAVAVFCDCSKSDDATVIAGCRIDDGHVFGLGIWQRPHGDRGTGWLAPRDEVKARLMWAIEHYDVQWLGIDPSPARDDETEAQYWQTMVDELHQLLRDEKSGGVLVWATPGRDGSAVAFDMRLSVRGGADRNRQFTEAAELTAADIDEDPQRLTHDGDPAMRMHVHNARRRPNQWGVTLAKETRDSSRKVDYAVAMVGARLGRRQVLNSGKNRRKRSGRVW